MQISSGKKIIIIGMTYDIFSNTHSRKAIFIEDGKITKILSDNIDISLFPNYHSIVLDENEIVFPNFINLHTHNEYNILPIWNSNTYWTSRHQWRNNKQYKKEIKELIAFVSEKYKENTDLVSELISLKLDLPAFQRITQDQHNAYYEVYKLQLLSEVQKAYSIITEIMAVCGATGIILQSMSLDDENPSQKNFIIRNTGNPDDLGIPNKKINAVVDFYKPCKRENPNDDCSKWSPLGLPTENTSDWEPYAPIGKDGKQALKTFTDSVNNSNIVIHSTIVHIAEGRAGIKDPVDSYSRKEAIQLLNDLKEKVIDQKNLKESNLVLVHASGFNFEDPSILSFFRENNISLVWSPLSNYILYNDTLPIKKILEADINVCLGTDWTPSGSKHMLDELKFAKTVCEKQGLSIDSYDILKMATLNPAKALGVNQFSGIKEGGPADLFILKNPDKKDNPLELLLSSPDYLIKCVMINGRFVYGDKAFFSALNVDSEAMPEDEGVYIKEKAISLNKNINFNLKEALHKIDTLLSAYNTGTINYKVNRTKFLASDDEIYQTRIQEIKTKI